MNDLVIQASPVLRRDLPPFLHNLQNAPCKFSSNSNQGKVSSHFLLYLLIPDPDLEGGLEVELEQCFLGGLGCTSIIDSLPSSESLELETIEDLDALLKYDRYPLFLCASIYIPLNMMMCLVLFSSINRYMAGILHTSYLSTTFVSNVISTLKVLYHGSAWVNFWFLTI